MKLELNKLGSIGLITDVNPHDLPSSAITDGKNVSFINGYITPAKGYESYVDLAPITGTAQYLIPLQTDTDYFWIFPADIDGDGTAEKIYKYDGGTTDNITRVSGGDYTSDNQWNGCILHGVVILNNGEDAPQKLFESDANCTNLIYDGVTDWETQDYKAKVIRSHRNFLFALNVTDAGARYRTMVHWSSPAVPGSAPSSWDYTDQTELSNRRVLSQTNGEVIDGLTLRDDFFVYKEDSAYVFTFTEDPTFVFSSRSLFLDRGIYAQDCVVDIGGEHFVVGDGRVYIHDGTTPRDVLYGRNAKALFGSIDQDNYQRTFCIHNRSAYEVWVCYPEAGVSVPNKALVYNYLENTWSPPRDIPSIYYAALGVKVASSVSDYWDYESVMTWDAEDELVWNEQQFSPIGDALVGAGAHLWHMDTGLLYNGSTPDVSVERSGLIIESPGAWYMITEGYPKLAGASEVQLRIGGQKAIGGPVTWSNSRTVGGGSNRKVNFRVNAPIHAWQLSGAGDWRLYGMDVIAKLTGGGR